MTSIYRGDLLIRHARHAADDSGAAERMKSSLISAECAAIYPFRRWSGIVKLRELALMKLTLYKSSFAEITKRREREREREMIGNSREACYSSYLLLHVSWSIRRIFFSYQLF